MKADLTAINIHCSVCSWPLPAVEFAGGQAVQCPSCKQPVEARVFPAMLRTQGGGAPEKLAGETEASCFYHPQNRAVKPCDDCGRFLCSLCELDISGKTLCPVCFAAQSSGRKLQDLETSRTMHDSIALSLATLPLVLFWPVVFTAPMAIYWSIRHWNSPRSVIPRSRVRFYFAILFGVAEIGLVAFVIATILLVRK